MPLEALNPGSPYVRLRTTESSHSPRNQRMIRKWFSACKSDHTACQIPGNDHPSNTSTQSLIFPTRLIDIGSPLALEQHQRIVDTDELMVPVDYVSLSHRWAKQPQLKTKRCNILAHRDRLPLDKLPPTFTEAIEVTRQLGLRYLWIDSLCIIQEDEADWRVESQKMGDIFKNSAVTIAAADAVGTDADMIDYGLSSPHLIDRLAVKIILPLEKLPLNKLSQKLKRGDEIFVWKYIWRATPSLENEDQHTVVIRPRTPALWKTAQRSKWYNRGWVLQEILLSRRMIYFTKHKLYWSCYEATRDEGGGDPEAPFRFSLFSTKSHRDPTKSWAIRMSEYVRCELSYGSDRLMAIAGIASIFTSSHSINIQVGIVEDPTGESLLWYTRERCLSNLRDFHAPSWSWASLDGLVSFDMLSPEAAHPSSLIQNLKFGTVRQECGLQNSHQSCNTCVTGRLCFRGPVGRLLCSNSLKHHLENIPESWMMSDDIMSLLLGSAVRVMGKPLSRYDPHGNRQSLPRGLFVPDHTVLLKAASGPQFLGFMIPDLVTDSTNNDTVICVGIQRWGQSQPARDNDSIDIIALQEIDRSPFMYRRVGRGRVICNSWLSTCKDEDIIIA